MAAAKGTMDAAPDTEAYPTYEEQVQQEPLAQTAEIETPGRSVTSFDEPPRNTHMTLAAEGVEFIADTEPPAKAVCRDDAPTRRSPAQRGVPPPTVWKKKTLCTQKEWRELQQADLASVARVARVNSAYRVPLRALQASDREDAIAHIMTARPKSKRYQGRETSIPWPMYQLETDAVLYPRYAGLAIFGAAAHTATEPGLPLNPAITDCP